MATFNLTDATNLFKIKYGKISDNVYNSANVLLGRIKKDHSFTGKQQFVPVPTSFQGGVGSGTLPEANAGIYKDAIITAKKVYSVVEIEREAIKASANDEGAFVRGTREVVEKGVESYMRNASRILFNGVTSNGTDFENGAVCRGNSAALDVSGTGVPGDPYVVVLNSDTKEADIEEQDGWNYDTETTVLVVESYVPSTFTVSLIGSSVGLGALSGAGPVASTTNFYMQKSAGNDPQSLNNILTATSGSLYTVPVARRWQATQIAAGGAGVSTDIMNQAMLEVQRKCGKVPNLIITSFTQYRKILNLLEDQKQYILEPRSRDLMGKVSFKGLEFMSASGPVGIFPERFCQDDTIYFLNDNFITNYHRPGFGWFEDDGTVFLRKSDSDDYQARYGGYYETYIAPSFHGIVNGLAT